MVAHSGVHLIYINSISMAYPIPLWRHNIVESSPSSPPISPPIPGPSPESTLTLDPLMPDISPQGMDMDDMLKVCVLSQCQFHSSQPPIKGLYLPASISSADAIAISIAYSTEREMALEAEATIAERRYQQVLIAARCYRLQMVGARTLHKKVKEDIRRFDGYVRNRIPVVNTGSKSSLVIDQPAVMPLKRYSTYPSTPSGIWLLNLNLAELI